MPYFCDIVMKGGVTSGVVYPPAVVEIARTFSFKNIGGTSAGAIAAAVTAAAQLARIRGSEDGFEVVAAIPNELATDGLLFKLFRPNHQTSALYNAVTALAGRRRPLQKVLALLTAHPVAAAFGAAPAIALLLRSKGSCADVALALPLAAAGAVCGSLAAFSYDFIKEVRDNGYGLVTGISDDDPAAPALTAWLEEKLRLAAGISDPKTPLTFAMLWDSAVRGPSARHQRPDAPDVNLEMVTTCLSLGRPFKFPFDTKRFFFCEDEMRRYFPANVVDWMIKTSRPADPNDAREQRRFPKYRARKLYALPPMGDLPVIVATRMSLSFPVLFSAVPLRVADFTLQRNQETTGQPVVPELEQCWFTDGGLSSNFPIALFDSPLPRWPTFAINLSGFPDGNKRSADESQNVRMPKSNSGGIAQPLNRFHNLLEYFATIFATMQNWGDVTQSILPGYRDRIVTIELDGTEGGLNLDMPRDVLSRLRARGQAAGALISQHFADAAGGVSTSRLSWANHRWLRLRTLLGALRSYLEDYHEDYTAAQSGLHAFIDKQLATSVYRGAGLTADDLSALLAAIDQLATDLQRTPGLLDKLPKPPPLLALRPDLSSTT